MTPRKRHYHKWRCSQCGQLISTSSYSKHYVCSSCRRAIGLTVMGRSSLGYTALTVAPQQIAGFGRCEKCKRGNQALSNGRCEDCRFYGIPENDWVLNERGRGGKHRV